MKGMHFRNDGPRQFPAPIRRWFLPMTGDDLQDESPDNDEANLLSSLLFWGTIIAGTLSRN